MTTKLSTYLHSSVFKKQVVAITGLLLVAFVIGHLCGNCIIYLGPAAFNHYAETLHAVPELLWIVRITLVTALIVHVYFTILVTLENRAAGGGNRYAVAATHGATNMAKKFMILSGAMVFFFLILHLSDFTISDKTGPATALKGQEYAIYGLLWNSFLNPVRVLVYLAAVWCVGMHLTHGIQSLFQTIGFFHERYTPGIRKASVVIGILVATGFSLIPLYVIIRNAMGGPAI